MSRSNKISNVQQLFYALSSSFTLSELILIRLVAIIVSLEIFFFNQSTACLSPLAEYSQQKYSANLTTCRIFFMVLFDFTQGFYFFIFLTQFFYCNYLFIAVQLLITVVAIAYCFIHCFPTKSGFLKPCFLYSGHNCK